MSATSPPRRNFRGPLLSIYIGSDSDPFVVHKDLLGATSALFRRYLSEDALTLPDEDPQLFEIYAQWLYARNSKAVLKELRAHELVPRDDGSGVSDQPGADTLFHLFCLGERIHDVKFKNAVIDAYIDATIKGEENPIHLAGWIYERLPEASTFKRLYIDIWCWNSDVHWFEDLQPRDDPLTAPGAFWLDVLKKKTALGRNVYDGRLRAPWVADRGQYHEEECEDGDDGEELDATKDENEDLEVVIKTEADM